MPKIDWREQGRADIRRLAKDTAMELFDGVLRYARNGIGNVKPLRGKLAGFFRLRVGDYRVLFTLDNDTMRIFRVRHRSEAYRE